MKGRHTSEVILISSKGGARGSDFTPIFYRRELIKALALRSIRSRYRDTKLGLFWAIVQPLVYMTVLNVFFGLVMRFDTGGVPYPLHLLTGLVFFQLFAKGLNEGAGSIRSNHSIMSRIYIPPIVFPASTILSGLVDFIFPFFLLIIFLVYYQIAPNWNILFFPIIFSLFVLLYCSVQLFMSVMAVRFKDIGVMVPILAQLLFFGTPIFYPLSAIPEQYTALFAVNPMVGIVELFRWSILGLQDLPHQNVLFVSCTSILIFFITSIIVFQRMCRKIFNYLDN